MINNKVFTTVEEQIKILKNRNMIISDEEQAKKFLQKVNYYIFTGYTHYFRGKNDNFNSKISFDDIMLLYSMDNDLKVILLKYLLIIETEFNTAISCAISKQLGLLGYLDYSPKVYIEPFYYNINQKLLKNYFNYLCNVRNIIKNLYL